MNRSARSARTARIRDTAALLRELLPSAVPILDGNAAHRTEVADDGRRASVSWKLPRGMHLRRVIEYNRLNGVSWIGITNTLTDAKGLIIATTTNPDVSLPRFLHDTFVNTVLITVAGSAFDTAVTHLCDVAGIQSSPLAVLHAA